MFNFKKYFVPMSQYMAAQTQIIQLTAKKDSLEADITELESSINEEMRYNEELLKDKQNLSNELGQVTNKLMAAKDCIRLQKYLSTLLFTFIIGELFVIIALI